MLSRVILAEKYGAEPKVFSRRADLALMLAEADAALVIGDAALHLDPATLPFETLDLGAEWVSMTTLPMVFAVWSGRSEIVREPYAQAFLDSVRYGLAHIDDIAREQPAARNVSEDLAREYLTRHIVFELGERDYQGMQLYLDHALRLDRVMIPSVSLGGISA
jgi:predicted solute-binding protein